MKTMQKIFVSFFLLFIGGLFILTLITPDQQFSEQENRYLQQRPAMTFQGIVTGEFMDDFEAYLKDQFAYKTKWLYLKTISEILLLKQENNEVYFGKNHYLLEHFPPPPEQLQRNIENLNIFSEQNDDWKTYMMIIPTAADIYEEKLPAFAPTTDQQKVLKEIKDGLTPAFSWIDVTKALTEYKQEEIYFKTDHHWTMRGAFYAYEQAIEQMGFTPYTLEDFYVKSMSNSFYGTLYSKANAYHVSPDFIEVFQPHFNINYQVTLVDEEKTTNSLYDPAALETKDKYSYFLHGNHRLLTIKTDADTSRKLAVIKDSYAHAFLPFLANHYAEIHVIDLRYFKQDLLSYLEDYSLNEILFLYNLSNFATDTNLTRVR